MLQKKEVIIMKKELLPETTEIVSGNKIACEIDGELISLDSIAIEIDGNIIKAPLASKP